MREIYSRVNSLQDFMAGKLPSIPGEYPNLNDWENHLTTIFPEVYPLSWDQFAYNISVFCPYCYLCEVIHEIELKP